MSAVTVRRAQRSDLNALLELDSDCFPESDVDRERPAPGEIEAGLEDGLILVAERGDVLVGFLHVDYPSDRHFYIAALGVHPEAQGRGVGARLLDSFLESRQSERVLASMSTVTSPRNLPMLGLLLSRGFVVRNVMRGYFGEDKDRFYCQLRLRHRFLDPDDRYLVPVQSLDQVYRLLDSERYVLTDLIRSPSGQVFEVSRFDEDDLASLQASESSAGIAFSTAILAAITFLLAFAFASPRYPDAARALLVVATLTATASLIVYANASGELARLRSNTFESYMKRGNLLSEYGGVTPFVLTLPVTFASVTDNRAAAVIMAVLCSVALLVYELSGFALLARYPRTPRFVVPAVCTSLLPIAGVLLPAESAWSWAWTGSALAVLAIRIAVALPSDVAEQMTPADATARWQVRR